MKAKSPHGWSLKQGLAAQYGAQAGLDPDLAASAGEAGWDVLKSLHDAVDESDPACRAKRVKQTQRYLAKANLGRELVHAIQQRLAALSQANRAQPSINPETGLQEFYGKGLGGTMREEFERSIDESIKDQLPEPSLDPSILSPPLNQTPEYVSERLLYNQGTRDEMAQRVDDYTNDLIANSRSGSIFSPVNPNDIPVRELGAAMRAVEKKINPENARVGVLP